MGGGAAAACCPRTRARRGAGLDARDKPAGPEQAATNKVVQTRHGVSDAAHGGASQAKAAANGQLDRITG